MRTRTYIPWAIAVLGICILPALGEACLRIRLHPLLWMVIAGGLVFGGVLATQGRALALQSPAYRRLRWAILATNYGRDAGWYVERAGLRVAMLTEPRFEEMFWDSYRIGPLTDDADERRRMLSDPDWWLRGGLTFRNAEFGMEAFAFASGRVFTPDGRVVMRGLIFRIDPPSLCERLLLRPRYGVLAGRHRRALPPH